MTILKGATASPSIVSSGFVRKNNFKEQPSFITKFCYPYIGFVIYEDSTNYLV